MATSSCESSLAPVDFELPRSFESSEALSVAVERCPLCTTTRRPFHCASCINSGNYTHSTAVNKDSFYEGQQNLNIKKNVRDTLLSRINLAVTKQHLADIKTSEINECKRKIDLLKSYIASSRRRHVEDEKLLVRMKERNARSDRDKKRHDDKMGKIKKHLNDLQGVWTAKQSTLGSGVDILRDRRKFNIKVLERCIFSIQEIQPKSETENLAMSTISELKEATQTTFVRGHWVYTDNGGNTGHRIVEPSLPANGDYSAYNVWVAQNKENGAAPEKVGGHRNHGHTISAALCYTTQLVSVLAFVLDVCLPRKLCYSEFCLSELGERQLNNAVARLNHNVLHLCFSQNVAQERLLPRHTLHNVVMLLNCPELGRISHFEVSDALIQSISDSNTSEETDDDYVSEDEVDIGVDWERVPPDLEIPTRVGSGPTSTVYTMAYSGMPTDTTHSTAGSLVASAAASVASMWRAAASQFERR